MEKGTNQIRFLKYRSSESKRVREKGEEKKDRISLERERLDHKETEWQTVTELYRDGLLI